MIITRVLLTILNTAPGMRACNELGVGGGRYSSLGLVLLWALYPLSPHCDSALAVTLGVSEAGICLLIFRLLLDVSLATGIHLFRAQATV